MLLKFNQHSILPLISFVGVVRIKVTHLGITIILSRVIVIHHHTSIGPQHRGARSTCILLFMNKCAVYCFHTSLRTIINSKLPVEILAGHCSEISVHRVHLLRVVVVLLPITWVRVARLLSSRVRSWIWRVIHSTHWSMRLSYVGVKAWSLDNNWCTW